MAAGTGSPRQPRNKDEKMDNDKKKEAGKNKHEEEKKTKNEEEAESDATMVWDTEVSEEDEF